MLRLPDRVTDDFARPPNNLTDEFRQAHARSRSDLDGLFLCSGIGFALCGGLLFEIMAALLRFLVPGTAFSAFGVLSGFFKPVAVLRADNALEQRTAGAGAADAANDSRSSLGIPAVQDVVQSLNSRRTRVFSGVLTLSSHIPHSGVPIIKSLNIRKRKYRRELTALTNFDAQDEYNLT